MNISCIAVLAIALALALTPAVPAQAAQAGSAMDLISAVNAYRASSGLEPYGIDGGLMSLAQGQSEYQASVKNCTHQRSDGGGPADHGIAAENVACGLNLSAHDAVYRQWTDQTHLSTMLGPTTGLVGAGAASAGDSVYYTLDVKLLSGSFEYKPPQNNNPGPNSQDEPTQPPAGSIATSTPNGDGSIAHVIKYGETLVEIAQSYGISLNDLISMNKLDPKKPVYYAGQVLIIRAAFTLTPYITATYTPRPPTRTPGPTRTPRPTKTATPIQTPVPTHTATAEPLVKLPTLDDLGPGRPVMAYAFIIISAIGLVVLLLTSFWPERK